MANERGDRTERVIPNCKQHEDLWSRIFEKCDTTSECLHGLDKRLAIVETNVSEILRVIRSSSPPPALQSINWQAIAKFIGLVVAAAGAGAGGVELLK